MRSLARPLFAATLAVAFAVSQVGCAGPQQRAVEDQDDEADAQNPAIEVPRASRGPAPLSDGNDPLPQVNLTAPILFQLLAAEIAVQRGQTGSAASTYLTLAQQTRDPRLARRATELALAERSLERAQQSAALWKDLAPTSALASQTVETLWLSTGRLTDAEPLLARRLAQARDEGKVDEAYRHLQRVLPRAPDKSAALAMLERLAKPDGKVASARSALAAVAHAAQMYDRAAEEGVAASRLQPDDEQLAVTAARYTQQSAGGPLAAGTFLDQYLKRHPKATEARHTYAQMLAAGGNVDGARAQMELGLKQDPENPTLLFALAQIAYQTQQSALAEDYLQRYVKLPPGIQRDNDPAFLFLAQIAEDDKRPAEAITWLEQVRRGEQYLTAVVRRALLMGRIGKVDEARDLLRNTSVTSNRDRVQLTSAEAAVLREAQRNQEAFDVLNAALERLPNNPELLYDHGMAAERIDRLPVMESSLRKLIQLRPDHAHAYNALGYTFADRNIRLEEAQGLIEKALQLSPEDPHIVDSLGWVQYRRGRNEEAIATLRRAYAIRPEADIAAHLGEVLWHTGRAEEARKLWREARGREPNNETLKQTLARLNVSL